MSICNYENLKQTESILGEQQAGQKSTYSPVEDCTILEFPISELDDLATPVEYSPQPVIAEVGVSIGPLAMEAYTQTETPQSKLIAEITAITDPTELHAHFKSRNKNGDDPDPDLTEVRICLYYQAAEAMLSRSDRELAPREMTRLENIRNDTIAELYKRFDYFILSHIYKNDFALNSPHLIEELRIGAYEKILKCVRRIDASYHPSQIRSLIMTRLKGYLTADYLEERGTDYEYYGAGKRIKGITEVIEKLNGTLLVELDKSPAVLEIVKKYSISPENYSALLSIFNLRRPLSIHGSPDDSPDDGGQLSEVLQYERTSSEEETAEYVAEIMQLTEEAGLTTQEHRVLQMHVRDGELFRVIGEKLGFTESRASQIMTKAGQKLKQAYWHKLNMEDREAI